MIEHPDGGSWSREYPSAFEMHNHSKKSVAIDLETSDGRAVFLDLAEEADVVVEGFRPGVAERLGVGYESVSERNPEAVYCSLSSYGTEGRLASHPGHDLNFYGRAGLLHPEEREGRPTPPGALAVDVSTAVFVALSVVTALHGDGTYVDLSMQDVAVNLASPNLSECLGVSAPERSSSLTTSGYPCYATYRCADGAYLSVGAYEQHFWEHLCEELSITEHAGDQWAEGETRAVVTEKLSSRFEARPRAEWLETLRQADVPVAPVNSPGEVLDEEVIRDRDLVRDVPGGRGEDSRAVTFPALFADHEISVLAPPGFGQHSRELLLESGYEPERVDDLFEAEVLAGGASPWGAER
jgi:crotonobetainyl-CoA:carnitine CoA-transferase CaiB-like acyl-CoA transferase